MDGLKIAAAKGVLGRPQRLQTEESEIDRSILEQSAGLDVAENVVVSGLTEIEEEHQDLGTVAKQIMECFYKKDWTSFESEICHSEEERGRWAEIFAAEDNYVCQRAFAKPMVRPSPDYGPEWTGYSIRLHQMDGEGEFRKFHRGGLDPGPYYTRRALLAQDLSHPSWMFSSRRYHHVQWSGCMSSGVPAMAVHGPARCTSCRGMGKVVIQGEVFQYLDHHVRPTKKSLAANPPERSRTSKPKTRTWAMVAAKDPQKKRRKLKDQLWFRKVAAKSAEFEATIPFRAPCWSSSRNQAAMNVSKGDVRLWITRSNRRNPSWPIVVEKPVVSLPVNLHVVGWLVSGKNKSDDGFNHATTRAEVLVGCKKRNAVVSRLYRDKEGIYEGPDLHGGLYRGAPLLGHLAEIDG